MLVIGIGMPKHSGRPPCLYVDVFVLTLRGGADHG